MKKKEIIDGLSERWIKEFRLEQVWEGDGPRDFRPGSARLVCEGLFYEHAATETEAVGLVRFKAIFGPTAEQECWDAWAHMVSAGIPANQPEIKSLWYFEWAMTI